MTVTDPVTPTTAVERLAAALHKWQGGQPTQDPRCKPVSLDNCPVERIHRWTAKRILAADPQLAEAIELGLAWQAAEAALPEGWDFDLSAGRSAERASASAWPLSAGISKGHTVFGDNPAKALTALTEQLRKAIR